MTIFCFSLLEQGLSLMVEGSHEGHQEFDSGSDICVRPSCQSMFHYVKYKHPTLEVKLPKNDIGYSFVCCSFTFCWTSKNMFIFHSCATFVLSNRGKPYLLFQGPCSYDPGEGSLNVQINSLPSSKKLTLAEVRIYCCLLLCGLRTISTGRKIALIVFIHLL